MCLRVLRAVCMTLHRHVRDRALQVFTRHTVFRSIGACELREVAGCRAVRGPLWVQRAPESARQTAIAGVLELLDTERKRNVACTGRDAIYRAAERFGAGRAE